MWEGTPKGIAMTGTMGQLNRSEMAVRQSGLLEILDGVLRNLTLAQGALNELETQIEGPQEAALGERGPPDQIIGLRDYALEAQRASARLAAQANSIREKL